MILTRSYERKSSDDPRGREEQEQPTTIVAAATKEEDGAAIAAPSPSVVADLIAEEGDTVALTSDTRRVFVPAGDSGDCTLDVDNMADGQCVTGCAANRISWATQASGSATLAGNCKCLAVFKAGGIIKSFVVC